MSLERVKLTLKQTYLFYAGKIFLLARKFVLSYSVNSLNSRE